VQDPDPRVSCTTCHHLRGLTCTQPRAAGLQSGELSVAFTKLQQHCPSHHQRRATTKPHAAPHRDGATRRHPHINGLHA